MISNYAALVESISDELSRNDLYSKIPEWISMAELSLGRFVGLLDGEQVATGTLTAGATTFALPAGCKKVIHIELGAAPDLKILETVSWATFSAVKNNDTSGTPRAAAYIGRTAHLAPAVGEDTAYTLYYYGKPTPLSDENPTNDLLEMGADVLKYSALVFSAPYLGEDERISTWSALVAEGKATLKKEYWNAKAQSGVLRIRPDIVGGDGRF